MELHSVHVVQCCLTLSLLGHKSEELLIDLRSKDVESRNTWKRGVTVVL